MLKVKKRAWTLFGTLIFVLAAIQIRSQTRLSIPYALTYRAQTACRDYVQRNLKAPDSAAFQDESEDVVEWKKNVDCQALPHAESSAGNRGYVVANDFITRIYYVSSVLSTK